MKPSHVIFLSGILLAGCSTSSTSMQHDAKSMAEMTATLEGKTGDEFDHAFLEEMIPHHQGAIDMANLALKNAKHSEIKNMAKAIIDAQQKEISQMQQWSKAWGYDEGHESH